MVAAEAQITHSERKLANASKLHQDVEKSRSELKARVDTLNTELAKVKKQAEAAAKEAQQKAAANDVVLSEESLEEYRNL